MSIIEPTEEQREAAVKHHYKYAVLPERGYLTDWVRTGDATGREDVFAVVISLARLLAEREAKLREEVARWRSLVEFHKNNADIQQAEVAKFQRRNAEYERRKAKLDHDIEAYERGRAQSALLSALPLPSDVVAKLLEHDTLRARVAELETQVQKAAAVRNNLAYALNIHEHREAQHLADIKALRPLFERVKDAQFENYEDAYRAIYKCGGYDLIKQADAVFAHYDDAKADAPASTEGEATDE